MDPFRSRCYPLGMSGKRRSNPDAQPEVDEKYRKQGKGKGSPSPYDTFFKAWISDPVHVQALLNDHLPNEIASKLADTPPKILDGTFVDEALRSTQSDLLVEVEGVSGGPTFVYFFLEHGSYPDPGIALQLGGNMFRIWHSQAQGKAERLWNLPPIIPIVLYTGQALWTVPESLPGMIVSEDPELIFLPGERFVFRWLTGMAPEVLTVPLLLKSEHLPTEG